MISLITLGGQVVCGDLNIGYTVEQDQAGLNKRAGEIRAEEADKHVQLQKLMEATEHATEVGEGQPTQSDCRP